MMYFEQQRKNRKSMLKIFYDKEFIENVVAKSEFSILRELVREDSSVAWECIEMLILHGESKKELIKICAFYGRLDFLEKCCERGWHDYNGSYDDVVSSASEGSKVNVLSWLDLDLGHFKKKHMTNSLDEIYDDSMSWSFTYNNVEMFEIVWSHLCRIRRRMNDDWKHDACYEAIIEWAPSILDFLCTQLGLTVVTEAVEHALENEDDTRFHFAAEASKWLKGKKSCEGNTSLIKDTMSLVDEIKDSIPEGHYLRISNLLLRAYRLS